MIRKKLALVCAVASRHVGALGAQGLVRQTRDSVVPRELFDALFGRHAAIRTPTGFFGRASAQTERTTLSPALIARRRWRFRVPS